MLKMEKIRVLIRNKTGVDKNYLGPTQQKLSKGRCTIENASLKLPLKEEENEIMISSKIIFMSGALLPGLMIREDSSF